MKAAVCSPNPENEEEGKLLLEGELIARMEDEASQELDCDNNCLSGIKWRPEHHKKDDQRKRDAFNGFRKLKTGIVTTVGRTSKLPARFMETDSESESSSSRKRVRARRNSKATSGGERTPCTSTKRKTSRNGRLASLEKSSDELLQGKTEDQLVCSALVDGFDAIVDIQREDFASDTNTTKMNAGCNLSRTLTQGMKRKFLSSQSETETSSEEIRPRKRGRPFKNQLKMEQTARAKAAKSLEASSPHGDNCLTSATNATLTSPSTLKPRRKKRKLLNGLRRSKGVLRDFSAEESSGSEAPTPKRRGRPPKHLSSPKSEPKQRKFGSQNGVKKPWVRPVLKALHKRALFRSPETHLDTLLTPSEGHFTKVKTKLVKVNGRTLPEGCLETVPLVKRRGRPPKQSPHKLSKPKRRDDFVFTEEGESGDYSNVKLKAKLVKLQKLQNLRMQKQLSKKPLGAGKQKGLKNHKKVITNKLKKKSIEKAKRTLNTNSTELEASVTTVEGSNNVVTDGDTVQRRRHRNKIDRVLGLRHNSNSEYEYLVQWKDGTSCWTSHGQAADYEMDLKEFLTHEYQELPIVNRLVYKAYFHDNLDEQPGREEHDLSGADLTAEDMPGSDIQSDEEMVDDEEVDEVEIEHTPKKRGRKPRESNDNTEFVCKEVSVQRLEDCIHIVVRRSSGKQMRVNLRIIDSLTFAMEDAAIDSVDLVVISGLGDDLFCGVDLDTIVTVPLDSEMKNYRKDVDKIRYLIQTIQHFPKPIVATINKPAQGLGAQLVALCDMVCDEASLGSPIDLALAKANGIVPYCFPRLMGQSALSEQLLMGQPISTPTTVWKDSLSGIFNGANFTSRLSASVKAMSEFPSVSCSGMYSNDRDSKCSAREEQWFAKELKLEEQRFQDSLRDLTAFWDDVTAQVS